MTRSLNSRTSTASLNTFLTYTKHDQQFLSKTQQHMWCVINIHDNMCTVPAWSVFLWVWSQSSSTPIAALWHEQITRVRFHTLPPAECRLQTTTNSTNSQCSASPQSMTTDTHKERDFRPPVCLQHSECLFSECLSTSGPSSNLIHPTRLFLNVFNNVVLQLGFWWKLQIWCNTNIIL